MKIALGAPGNGTILKDAIKSYLENDPRVESVIDLSAEGITYPAVSIDAAQRVVSGEVDRAILVCGTGLGTAIAANKVAGARAATAHDLITARGAVENYDAQILCMGQNIIAPIYATALVDAWLDARHDAAGFYSPKVAEISAFEAQRQ